MNNRTIVEKTFLSGTDARRCAFAPRRRQQAGQSVLIVLAILFLLAFLGALFVLVVIRNLENAQRQNQVLTADYYAQAGLNYANSMLQTSPLGADWRPPLQFGTNTTDVPGYTGVLAAALPNDPDKRWLDQGYSRYNLANGRFLLRITYDPLSATRGANAAAGIAPAANAKYLKIDVVGRQGVVDSSDPTTYTNSPSETLRAERIAYKPIGLVDYARFITNKDNRNDTAVLGVPSIYNGTKITTPGVYDISGVSTVVGTPSVTTLAYTPYPITTTFGHDGTAGALYIDSQGHNAPGGGSLRCNGNLRLYGNNQVFLDGEFGDDWEVAGDLTLDQYNAAQPLVNQAAQAVFNGIDYSNNALALNTPVYPTNDVMPGTNTSRFTTISGLLRDGSSGNDKFGFPRAITRLNPPVLDSTDPATSLTRYQTLTKPADSNGITSSWTPGAATNLATVSIDNSEDAQTETSLVGNPTTLREEWLRTAGVGATNWTGNFYNPPGVLITFGKIVNPLLTSTTTTYWGMTLTRTDKDSLGNPAKWPSTNSSALQVIYGQPPNATFIATLTAAQQLQYQIQPFVFLTQYDAGNVNQVVGSVVVYATGNVRVRGIVSNPNPAIIGGTATDQHVTIVTNGISYVEGSILKGTANATAALLARQYVCLNTTQFLLGAEDPSGSDVPGTTLPNPYYLDFAADTSVTLTNDGLLPTVYVDGPTAYVDGSGNSVERLYVSEQSGSTGTAVGDFALAAFSGNSAGVFNPAQSSTPTRTSTSLNLSGTAPNDSGNPFTLTFRRDPISTPDWLLERAAVLPGRRQDSGCPLRAEQLVLRHSGRVV